VNVDLTFQQTCTEINSTLLFVEILNKFFIQR
jgi:hypothetical protein